MVKPLLYFLFLRLIPLWVVSIPLLILFEPFVHGLQGQLVSPLWLYNTSIASQPVTYWLESSPDTEEVAVSWDRVNELSVVSAFSGQSGAIDNVVDLPLGGTELQHWLVGLNTDSPVIEASDNRLIWRPSRQNYKKIVYRSGDQLFVDQVLRRQYSRPQVSLSAVTSGFITVPVDIYAGLYLPINLAPEPELGEPGDFHSIRIAQLNAATRLFLKEIWALDNQYWAVTTWWAWPVAGLLMIIPIVLLPGRRYLLAWVLLLGGTNLAIVIACLSQFKVIIPVVLPLIVLILAAFWSAGFNRLNARINALQQKYAGVSERWINHLLDDGKPEAAYRYLIDNDTEKQQESLWVSVAATFERNRQLDKALECYQLISTRAAQNSEIKQKVKLLTETIDPTKTVALGLAKSELPVGKLDGLCLGRYQIETELGRGAMGIVYQAIDPKIHRSVALKVVHLKSLGVDEVDQVKQRFFREAQAAGKLNHPNIVTVYDVGEEHDVAYIAMDLLKGKSLSEVIQNDHVIDLKRRVEWIADAADALGYAHENDIIHRDIKPANMIISERTQQLKITDFGVARIAGINQTQTGIVLGSPTYMSPEQIRGESLTGQTDIFSLGVTLYQSLTGQLPFIGDTLPSLAYAITQSKQKSPRVHNADIPVSMVRIVNRSLSKDATERYATAYEFAQALRKWLKEH